MKRDIDLCRKILQKIEDIPEYGMFAMPPEDFGDIEEDPAQHDAIFYNMRLLTSAGLVDGKVSVNGFVIAGLSWEGHEFLEASRDETIWVKAKKIVSDKAGGIAFEVLKGTLLEMAKIGIKQAIG